MLTTDQLQHLAAMIADGFPGVLDWLIDFATAADLPHVLLAYAGPPPDHKGGLPREALWRWLREVEPGQWCPAVGWTSGRYTESVRRWEMVRHAHWSVPPSLSPALGEAGVATENLEVKRRVLALFPEAKVFVPVDRLPAYHAALGAGCPVWQDDDGRLVVQVAAADLIPPEQYGASPLVEAYRSFRDLQTINERNRQAMMRRAFREP